MINTVIGFVVWVQHLITIGLDAYPSAYFFAATMYAGGGLGQQNTKQWCYFFVDPRRSKNA